MSPHLTAQTVLGDTYKVTRLIGVGGMGEVYEATHARLPGRYAIKVLLGDIPGRGESMQRFRREAEVTSALRHPNIVQVLDFNFTPDGHPYLVMEYLDGVELAQEIRRVRTMPIDRAVDIVGQIASGLAAAHSQLVVHRDLKPQNMFLVKLPGSDREVVKIVDFGISKVREVATKLTVDQAILGTPQYMAPEQAQGKLDQITDRTDQFALAATTYELLSGRPAFAGTSAYAILYQVVHEQPESLAKLVPSIGPAVEAVVFTGLAKAPADRYPSVLAFHAELLRAVSMDCQVQTMQTPSPLWLPSERSSEVQAIDPRAVNGDKATEGVSARAPVAPTALLPRQAPTALLPRQAPTALLGPSPAMPPDAVAAADPRTTLGASVGSVKSTIRQGNPSRHRLLWAVAATLLLLAGLGYGGMRLSGGQTKEGVASQAMPPAPPPPPPVPAVETIQMVYSSEKSAWLKAVTADFEKVNPDIRVDLVSRGSIDAANDILDERLKTTVWSPADTSLLAMLASEWRTKYKAPLFADAETARQPLLLTPLVFMIWEDRAQALMKAGGGTVRWKTIRQGMLSPKGWGGIGGEARWENVVLAHVDPRRSAAGLKALYSMLLEHAGKLRMGLEDLRNPKNLEFVRGIERNVTKVESSTATLATDMVRYGSSRYEIGVVYESNAIVALADAKGGWGKLKVFYPAPTLWSDNPAVVLTAPWVTEGQARAARRYVDYLRSRPAQVRTIEYGFRPADTSVSLNDSDGKNPFSQYADRGLSVEVPPAADMPDSATIRPLIAAWNSMMKP